MDLPIIHAAGEIRKLGCLPRVALPGRVFPLLESKIDVIPRSQWPKRSIEEFAKRALEVLRVLDQDGIGMCGAAASVGSLEETRRLLGLAPVPLSAGDLYRRVSGGRDHGSTLSDNLAELTAHGVATAEVCEELEWQLEPDGWEESAQKYRGLEWFDCPSFDTLATASLSGFLSVYGILVASNFEPNSKGIIPHYRRGGGGHALCALDGGPVYYSGDWYLPTLNSWNKSWGINGCALVPESYFGHTPFTDGWCLRSIVNPSDEPWKPIA